MVLMAMRGATNIRVIGLRSSIDSMSLERVKSVAFAIILKKPSCMVISFRPYPCFDSSVKYDQQKERKVTFLRVLKIGAEDEVKDRDC